MGKFFVAPPAAAGLLVQTDLGRLECTPPCALAFEVKNIQLNFYFPWKKRCSGLLYI